MPAKAPWLLHLPEIVAQLEVFEVPVIDRAIVESVFGLRRRRAVELLHCFGGYQAGRTFLVDRHVFIGHLRRLLEGEEFRTESKRKERLAGIVDQLRKSQPAAQVKIPAQRDTLNRNVANLSAGITLEPDHLHIQFSGTEDLLAKLYELSQAASNDFDRFQAATQLLERRSA